MQQRLRRSGGGSVRRLPGLPATAGVWGVTGVGASSTGGATGSLSEPPPWMLEETWQECANLCRVSHAYSWDAKTERSD